MNQNIPHDTDSDLEAFETPEEDFDNEVSVSDDDVQDMDDVSDLDFQDVDEDVFGEAPPSETPAKKKTNWFNIGVAAVAVLMAGGLIWTKLGPQLTGGDGDVSQQMAGMVPDAAPDAQQARGDSEAAAMAALNTPDSKQAAAGGLLDNPDQFSNLNQAAQPVPAPVVSASSDPFAALENGNNGQAAPMPTPVSGTPDMAQGPVIAGMPEPQAEQQPAPAAQQPVAETPAQPIMAEALPDTQGQDSTPLKEQVGALEKKFEALNSKLDTAIEQMASVAAQPQPVSAPVDDARLSAIQTTLDRLEARLDDLSSRKTTAVSASPSRSDGTQTAPKAAKKTTKAKPVKAVVSSRADDAPYVPPAAPVRAAVPASSGGSGGWALRGAQTGRAVIAKGSDLREVGVGETVPGLGEIVGIAMMNGRWVVQGTTGRVSQ